MQGSGKIKRNFKTAQKFFQKSLKVQADNILANFELGVMYMLGLGCEKDVPRAVEHFEIA